MATSNHESAQTQSFWTLTRIGLLGSAILLVAAIASSLYRSNTDENAKLKASQPAIVNNPTSAPVAPPPPSNPGLPRELAPAVLNTQFNLIDGKSKKLSDYSGKVIVVDIWATWCGPCRQEIPHLLELAKEYKSKGVEIVGLTTENPATDAQLVKDFSKEFKITYPLGWANAPVAGGLMNGRGGIPQTLIIGRDGKLRNHFVGFSAPISVPQMKAALDEAIAAS